MIHESILRESNPWWENPDAQYYESALKIRPNDAGALVGMGVAFVRLGMYEKAMECYDKALQARPNDESAIY